MKKLLILIVIMCTLQSVHSQEVYISAGKNFTRYDYKNSNGASNPNLKSGTGNFFELGYIKPLNNEKLAYSLGLALNEYNNVGGNSVNNYTWNTQYLGAKGGFSYSIISYGKFYILPIIGLNLETIVSGKQTINGTYYDLTKEKEFTGLLLSPLIGLQFKYNVSNLGYIGLGYNYVKTYNISNGTNQKLGFTTNQIQFRVHFEIKSNKLLKPVVSEIQPVNNTSSAIIPKEETISNDKENVIAVVTENSTKENKIKEQLKEETIPLNTNEVPLTANKSIFNFSAKGLSILQSDTVLIHKTIEYLIKNPNKILVLNGYSSNDGLNSKNIALSLKRAYVAKEYFILNGVPEMRIKTNGMGVANPKYPNNTVEGRLKNKRVEIEFK